MYRTLYTNILIPNDQGNIINTSSVMIIFRFMLLLTKFLGINSTKSH